MPTSPLAPPAFTIQEGLELAAQQEQQRQTPTSSAPENIAQSGDLLELLDGLSDIAGDVGSAVASTAGEILHGVGDLLEGLGNL